MDDPRRLYEFLLDHCREDGAVSRMALGMVWTICQSDGDKGKLSSGLAMTPATPVRTLEWPGSLVGRSLAELSGWLLDWNPHRAAVGMAALNCGLNFLERSRQGQLLEPGEMGSNLAVFDHFLPQLEGKKVVVIGRYPGIDRHVEKEGWQLLERMPVGDDYPDPAAEYLLPDADWVFLTATSIINKTFPRLAALSQSAKTVLMGPTTPWLPELSSFGIDYLAGVETVDPQRLFQTAIEGGGVRIFDRAVRYRVMALNKESMAHETGQCAAVVLQ